MKKERGFTVLLFILLIGFLSIEIVSAGFFDWIFGDEDLAPFNASVTIQPPNLSPIIQNLSSLIYVCESNVTSSYFNVSDNDANLAGISINPASPFFVRYTQPPLSSILEEAEIFSAVLVKGQVGQYSRVITAIDLDGYSDAANTIIEVIEINHDPNVTNLNPPGAFTIWTQGDNSIFNYQLNVSDVEDGTQDDGVLNFSIEFLDGAPRLFNISSNGTMYFDPNNTGNSTEFLGVYNISVCVEDNGTVLGPPHPNITTECGQDGLNVSVCEIFSLTVTDNNRAPNITSYYPLTTGFSADGTENIYFNVSVRDPDGTIPDVYWYVDGVLTFFSSLNETSEFSYSFGCEIDGAHTVRAEATDGLLNDSIQWDIGVFFVECPVKSGGGGGGGVPFCKEKWGCDDWNTCQNVKSSADLGLLSVKDFTPLNDICKENQYDETYCGFQIRECVDTNNCSTVYGKPDDTQVCYYTSDPSCFDDITNCHDEGCEVLVDCGGPCNACSTCSDEIQNQGELGIDCGGPCPFECPEEVPFRDRTSTKYILFGILLLLLIIIFIIVIKIIMTRMKISDEGGLNVAKA